jgi:hypothetical protein
MGAPVIPPEIPKLEKAEFRIVKGSEPAVIVHFNPESLQYTVQNTLKEEGQGAKKKQYVSQTTAKLTMQLIFDNTDTGEDIRAVTDGLAKLLKPQGTGDQKVPPQVEFGWGVYRFTGMVEQYKETIDFFAPGGVPLRSSIDITLASQDVVFDSNRNPSASVDNALDERKTPTVTTRPHSPMAVATALDDPRAARAIAAANGAESLRFSSGTEFAVGGSARLQGAAAFSLGAGAGFGIGGGAGFGISGGAGAGLSIGGAAGVGFGAGASFPARSAGGAFGQLRATSGVSGTMPNATPLLSGSAGFSTGSGVQFAAGGRVEGGTGGDLKADVGAGAALQGRLRFG